MTDENQQSPEADSVFVPLSQLNQNKPAAAPAATSAPASQTDQQDDQSVFVPIKQFEGRLRNESDSEDQRKSAISGIYEGVTRLPEAASGLIRSGIDEIQYQDLKRQEAAGKIPSADEAYADYKLAQEQAAEQSWLKKIPEAAEKYLPSYGYEPQTYAGAMAKEGTAGATELVAYPFLGAGGKMARATAGAASGLLGEGLRQKFEGTPYEPWVQFAGAFGGQLLGEAAANVAGKAAKGYKLWGAEKEFENVLSDAIQYDVQNNLTKISPEELQAKIKSGEPINVGEVLSPESKTFAVLQNLAGNVPGKKSNDMVAARLLDSSNSKVVNYGQLEHNLSTAAKEEADRVFDLARANPASNNITAKDIGEWVNEPVIQRLMNEIAGTANLPVKDTGRVVKVPETIPGQPAVPAGTETSLILDEFGNKITKPVPGKEAIPEQEIGGNINFWQKLKERLGREYATTGDTAFLDAKNSLVKALSEKVPEYGEALAKTFERYGDLDAANAGYNLMKNIGTKKAEDYLGLMGKMTEPQLQNFRDGIIANIYEKAGEAGGVKYLANQIGAPNSKFSYKLKEALGEDQYNKIAGSIIQQSMINEATTGYQKLIQLGTKAWENKATSLGVAGAATAALGYVAGVDVDKNAAVAGISSLLVGRQFAMNHLEKKIAPLALEAMRSPDGGRQLLQIMEKNPAARSFVEKFRGAALRATLAGGRSVGLGEQESPEPLQSYGMPSPNANGGRIAYKAGGRVKNARAVAISLLREIDQTRKMIGKKTEDILSMPDDAVATALKIARGNV